MDDIFPPFDRRGGWTDRPAQRPLALRLDTLRPADRQALVRMITGPATMTASGWVAGGKVLEPEAMRRTISDGLVAVRDPTEDVPQMQAVLTPRGLHYARVCLHARPPDVPGRPITPAT